MDRWSYDIAPLVSERPEDPNEVVRRGVRGRPSTKTRASSSLRRGVRSLTPPISGSGHSHRSLRRPNSRPSGSTTSGTPVRCCF